MSMVIMRPKATFEQVREEVRMDDQGKWDRLVRREELSLRDGDLCVPTGQTGEQSERLTPTHWATNQLCQRLGIPTGYFRKCPTVLQDMQANYWLKHPDGDENTHCDGGAESPGSEPGRPRPKPDEQWLLRARYATLRGVLSTRYSRLDNEALLGPVQQAVSTAGRRRFDISGFALSDESLHLRLVDPTARREALPDDGLMAGIHIANSEVGRRAVSVDAMVFRLVCTNGLIRLVRGRSLLYQRHIHLSQERFADALQGAISEALQQATAFMEQLARATREPVKDVEQAIERLARHWNLRDSTRERVRQALLSERPDQQETLYGVANAVTNAAQGLSADDRYDLEVLAGHLVEYGMSRTLRSQSPSARRSARESEVTHDATTLGGASANGWHASSPTPVRPL